MNLQVLQVLTNWFERTDLILDRELSRLKVNDTEALKRSKRHRVRQRANDLLEGELEFLVRGRMVDMGAGRARKIESRETNRELVAGKARKPKKWYSRAFWGRINDLQGILGYKLMESAIDSIKDPIEQTSSGSIGRPKL